MLIRRAYYLIRKDNYLKISISLICIFSIFAIILNIEGSNCIIQISSLPVINNNDVNTNEIISNETELTTRQQQQQHEEERMEQQQNQEELMRQSYDLRKYCFLVTNLYVYSLFGVIIGSIIIAVWYIRFKKIWSRAEKGR